MSNALMERLSGRESAHRGPDLAKKVVASQAAAENRAQQQPLPGERPAQPEGERGRT